MSGGNGDMKGIDSSFGWYLKCVRNHFRQFFHFRIGFENRNVLQINPSLISRFRVALVTLINEYDQNRSDPIDTAREIIAAKSAIFLAIAFVLGGLWDG